MQRKITPLPPRPAALPESERERLAEPPLITPPEFTEREDEFFYEGDEADDEDVYTDAPR